MKKAKSKLFFLCLQDATGQLISVTPTEANFSDLVVEGQERSKEANAFYTIINSRGQIIDTNFVKRSMEESNA
jgi:hypothetical protein